jgi:hypothetical protein
LPPNLSPNECGRSTLIGVIRRRKGETSRELRAAVKFVGILARLNLHVFAKQAAPLRLGEPGDGGLAL